jgi:hypothetical protein
MWISRESGRRRAMFPMLILPNASQRQPGDCLIHGTLCCGDHAHCNVIRAEKFLP